LEAAVANRDYSAVARIAHLIAGSCANLGATATRAALLDMENLAKAGDEAAVLKHLELVRGALNATHEAVKSMRGATS
jgi:HPt (histidine-containing phosphotransfer) domain-containing protein